LRAIADVVQAFMPGIQEISLHGGRGVARLDQLHEQ
jgi:hypothetical protein